MGGERPGGAGGVPGSGLDGRSVSPVVGLVLLIGIVIAGIAMLMIVGLEAMETYEGASEREHALSTVGELEYRLGSIAQGDQTWELPVEDANVHEGGAVTITFHDGDPADSDNATSVDVEPLGAVEYPVNGDVVAMEGGAVFEIADGGAIVHTAPPITYDGEDLQLQFMQLGISDPDDLSGVAESDFAEAGETTAAIETASTAGHSDVDIEVNSAYHAGWAAHFEDAMDAEDDNVTVAHEPTDERVTVSIANFTTETSHLTVADVDHPEHVAWNDPFELAATVENEGGATAVEEEVTLAVTHEGETATAVEEVTLEPDEEKTVTLEIAGGDVPGHDTPWLVLDQFGEREFVLETEVSEASGAFGYVADREAYLIEDHEHSVVGNESVVDLEVRNAGIENDSAPAILTVEADDEEVDELFEDLEWEESVQLEPWERGTATFSMNRSMLPDANYTYTARLEYPGDEDPNPCMGGHPDVDPEWCERTGEFEISGGAVGDVDEIIITEPSQVNASIIGTEITMEAGGPNQGAYLVWSGAVGDHESAVRWPDVHMKVDGTDNYGAAEGSMEMQAGGGSYDFDFVQPPPTVTGQEMPMNPNGGWMDASDNSNAPVGSCGFGWCEWEWEPQEITWREDGGYDLAWYPDGDGDYDWSDPSEDLTFQDVDQVRAFGGPITASVEAGDELVRFDPQGDNVPIVDPHQGDPLQDDLNTFGTQTDVYEYSTEVEEGTVTIESTLWNCDAHGYVGSDLHGSDRYWNLECIDVDEDNYIQSWAGADGGEEDAGFIMTRDAQRNDLQDIEEGFARQRSVQEVFEDAGVPVDEEDERLELGAGDFAFMNEVTMDREQLTEHYQSTDLNPSIYDPQGEYSEAFGSDNSTLWNKAAWDIAVNYRDYAPNTGDPNYNDVIGFVEVDGGGTYVEFDPDDFVEYTAPDGTVTLPETDYDYEDYEGDGGDVEAGSDYIVIS